MGPFDAFKAADLNKNGMITVDELRHQVKNLLGPDAMKSADLKLSRQYQSSKLKD